MPFKAPQRTRSPSLFTHTSFHLEKKTTKQTSQNLIFWGTSLHCRVTSSAELRHVTGQCHRLAAEEERAPWHLQPWQSRILPRGPPPPCSDTAQANRLPPGTCQQQAGSWRTQQPASGWAVQSHHGQGELCNVLAALLSPCPSSPSIVLPSFNLPGQLPIRKICSLGKNASVGCS